MIIFDRLSFALNLARGRNALFDKKYDLALEFLRKATSSGSVVNRGLLGEADIFTAICSFRRGDTNEAIKLYEQGLKHLQESGLYSMDELRYVSKYMEALLNGNLLVEDPIDIRNVRKSFRRDFPMEIATTELR